MAKKNLPLLEFFPPEIHQDLRSEPLLTTMELKFTFQYPSGFSFWEKLIAMEGSFHRLVITAFIIRQCQIDQTNMTAK